MTQTTRRGAAMARRPPHRLTRPPHAGPMVLDCVRTSRRTVPQAPTTERPGPWRWFAIPPILARLSRSVRLPWFVPVWRAPANDTIVATLGPVRIHSLPPACLASTCVKGTLPQARETGLRRLAEYSRGENVAGIGLELERPAILRQQAPDRWLVSARLFEVDDPVDAPTPRIPKVKVTPVDAELLAVAPIRGRPTRDAIGRGDATVLNTIAGTAWIPIGAPMLRVSGFGWLGRRFEVAVPVATRPTDRTDSPAR